MSDLAKLAEVLPDLSVATREKLGPILLDLLEKRCGSLLSKDNHMIAPAEFAALASGHKIDAVKLIRDRTGLTLVDSKVLVERYQEVMPKCPTS